MNRILCTGLFIAALALFGGCQSTKATKTCKCDPCTCGTPCPCTGTQASLGTMNDACPVSGRPIAQNSPSSEVNGTQIGFCCAGCKNRFDGMSAQDQATMVDNMKTSQS